MPASEASATPRRRSARLSATPEPTPAPRRRATNRRKELEDVSEAEVEIVEVVDSPPAPKPRGGRQRLSSSSSASHLQPSTEEAVQEVVEEIQAEAQPELELELEPEPEPELSTLSDRPLEFSEGAGDGAAAQVKASRLALRKRQLWTRLRIGTLISILSPLLILAGYLLPLALPLPPLGPDYYQNGNNGISKGSYVDENALQPGQAYVYFNHDNDVTFADQVAEDLASIGIKGAPLPQPAVGESKESLDKSLLGAMTDGQRGYLVDKLASLGLKPYVQQYTYSLGADLLPPAPTRKGGRKSKAPPALPAHLSLQGHNIFARFAAPRTDAREALVICAPWFSSWDGSDPADPDVPPTEEVPADEEKRRVNVRGVSTVLALARYLTTQSYIARDLIFVISDGHLAGMQAFLASVYAQNQTNLVTETLTSSRSVRQDLGGSVIWNALAIDYPSDSFGAIEILHEGLNGQLPNMDAFNTVVKVTENIGGVLMRIPGVSARGPVAYVLGEARGLARRLKAIVGKVLPVPLWADWPEQQYMDASEKLLRQIGLQAVGRTTGIHGLFTRYHIDAVTIRAVPATGPNGFMQMGRIAEGTVRAYNNLLERLHHSQFFYLFLSPHRFVPFGIYIPANILISVGLTFLALRAWLRLGEVSHSRAMRVYQAHRNRLVAGSLASIADVQVETPPADHLLRDLLRLAVQTKGSITFDPSVVAAELKAQSRPVGVLLATVAACHVVGFAGLRLLATAPSRCTDAGLLACKPIRTTVISVLAFTLLSSLLIGRLAPPAARRDMGSLLHVFAALHAGMLIAVGSVLNFSQAFITALLFGLPLALGVRAKGKLGRGSALLAITLYLALAPLVGAVLLEALLSRGSRSPLAGALARALPTVQGLRGEVEQVLWEWRVVRSVFVPYAMVGMLPIALEAAIAAGLDLFA